MFSYTRVNAKLGFGKTSFMNTPDSVQYDSGLKTWNHSTMLCYDFTRLMLFSYY